METNRMNNIFEIQKTGNVYINLLMHAYKEARCLHYAQQKSSYINVTVRTQMQNNREEVGTIKCFRIQR